MDACWSVTLGLSLVDIVRAADFQAQTLRLALDTGELAGSHARVFAGGQTFTDPAHQTTLEKLRGERHRREPEVQLRPLARYDALIPA